MTDVRNESIYPQQPSHARNSRVDVQRRVESQAVIGDRRSTQRKLGPLQRASRSGSAATAELPLEARLRMISKDLSRTMGAALQALLADHGGTHRLRPIVLTTVFGLDKSLASRIAKSLRENDVLKALHALPSPKGLQLLEHAFAEHGLSRSMLDAFSNAVDAYRGVLLEFSGGRTGLEASLAGWIPNLRAKAERDARRLVYRGLTTLDGTRTGTVYNSIYVQPSSEDSSKLDLFIVGVREDLRRLRPDEEIPLMVMAGHKSFGDWRDQRQSLDGMPMGRESEAHDDPRHMLIEPLCSDPVQELELVRRGESTVVRISKASLDVNELATVAFGWKMSEYFSTGEEGSSDYHHISFTASVPAECMTIDLFIHEDAVLVDEPVASVTRLLDMDHERMQAPPSAAERTRAAAPVVERLANSTSALSTQDIRDCEKIARHVTDQAGLDLEHFSVYRTRVEFPMTTEAVTLWLHEPSRTATPG